MEYSVSDRVRLHIIIIFRRKFRSSKHENQFILGLLRSLRAAFQFFRGQTRHGTTRGVLPGCSGGSPNRGTETSRQRFEYVVHMQTYDMIGLTGIYIRSSDDCLSE